MPSYVITGAAGTIGTEFVRQLVAKGNRVFALQRRSNAGRAYQQCQWIRDEHACLWSRQGSGTGRSSLMVGFKVNAVGHVLMTSIFLPLLRKGDSKRIWFITSGLGSETFLQKVPLSGFFPYGMGKAAQINAAVQLANMLRPEGFIVNAISPSVIPKPSRTAEEIQAMWDRLKSLDPKATKPLSEAIERCGRCESDIGCAWIFRPRGFGKGRRAVGE